METSAITPPTKEEILTVFTLASVKNYMAITHARDDEELKTLIVGAYREAERAARMAILTQTLRATFTTPKTVYGAFGIDRKLNDPDKSKVGLSLTKHPVQSITSIKFFNADNTVVKELTEDTDFYRDGRNIYWKSTLETPDTATFGEVVYVGGFAADSLEIEEFKTAIKEVVVSSYENKGMADIVIPTTAARTFRRYWTPFIVGPRFKRRR